MRLRGKKGWGVELCHSESVTGGKQQASVWKMGMWQMGCLGPWFGERGGEGSRVAALRRAGEAVRARRWVVGAEDGAGS